MGLFKRLGSWVLEEERGEEEEIVKVINNRKNTYELFKKNRYKTSEELEKGRFEEGTK